MRQRRTAEALGFLILNWSNLESEIDINVLFLLREYGLDQKIDMELVGHIDFSEKLQILRSLAFKIDQGKWFRELNGLMN